MFVFYVSQGVEIDLHELVPPNNLWSPFRVKARVCGTGQLLVIAGDLNADPSVVLATSK